MSIRQRSTDRLRRAFSLAEMLVALAVLVVVIAVVTNVFTISAKTAATSQAIGEVESAVRHLFTEIEADLRGVNPAESTLVLQGRTQAAARNEELRQARSYYRVLTGDPREVDPLQFDPASSTLPQVQDYPNALPTQPQRSRLQYSDPRADVMMFFTTRSLSSNNPPLDSAANLSEFNRALQRGAKSSLSQVVLGHASLAPVVRNANGTFNWAQMQNDTRHIEVLGSAPNGAYSQISPIPLNQWSLARRVALIDDDSDGRSGTANYPLFDNVRAVADSVGAAQIAFNRLIWGIDTQNAPTTRIAGDAAVLRFRDYLAYFAPRANGTGAALASPYVLTQQYGWQAGLGFGRQLFDNLMYPPQPATAAQFHHVATLIQNPPPELQANTALQALAGCAWFQVEFLMPEDPRNSIRSPLAWQRNDMPRWVEVPPGQMYVFVPDTQENRELVASKVDAQGVPLVAINNRIRTFGQIYPHTLYNPGNQNELDKASNRNIRLWPYAVRITVRVFDPRGKLDEPIVRSMVYRFEK